MLYDAGEKLSSHIQSKRACTQQKKRAKQSFKRFEVVEMITKQTSVAAVINSFKKCLDKNIYYKAGADWNDLIRLVDPAIMGLNKERGQALI